MAERPSSMAATWNWREVPTLLWLAVRVKCGNLMEYGRVVWRYYGNRQFAKADLLLLSRYLLRNPYCVVREHLAERGVVDVHCYGETPLTTLALICERCGITASDTVFELGAGRGRSCFWLRCIVGCRVVAIEWVTAFVETAQHVADLCGIEGVSFQEGDFCEADLTGATVVYLYGTCLADDQISDLSDRLARLPKGTRFITVSYPLSDYHEGFRVDQHFPATFPWGTAEIYLQSKLF